MGETAIRPTSDQKKNKDIFDKDGLTLTERSKLHLVPSNQDLMQRQWQKYYQNLNILKQESSVVGKLEYDTQYEESNPTSAVKKEQSGYEYCAIIDEIICDRLDDLSSTQSSAPLANPDEQIDQDNVNMLATRSNSQIICNDTAYNKIPSCIDVSGSIKSCKVKLARYTISQAKLIPKVVQSIELDSVPRMDPTEKTIDSAENDNGEVVNLSNICSIPIPKLSGNWLSRNCTSTKMLRMRSSLKKAAESIKPCQAKMALNTIGQGNVTPKVVRTIEET